MRPQRSVFDLVVEIGQLSGLAHPYILVGDRDQLVIVYLICSIGSKAVERNILTADTSTVVGMVGLLKRIQH